MATSLVGNCGTQQARVQGDASSNSPAYTQAQASPKTRWMGAQHGMVTGCWARSSAGWARCSATALEKAAASVSRDGGTRGSACERQWGKDRMRAVVRKEISLSFQETVKHLRWSGAAEQVYWARWLHRPENGSSGWICLDGRPHQRISISKKN